MFNVTPQCPPEGGPKPALLLSIIVVSFNTRELLRQCLSSIFDSPHHLASPTKAEAAVRSVGEHAAAVESGKLRCEVIVIDNASADGSASMVLEQYPAAKLLQATENLGFARATNWGLMESQGDLLLLLNPDTEVLDDALVQLAAFLRTDQRRVAAASPALQYPDGRPQRAAFSFPTLWMSFFDFFPLNHRVIDSRLNGRYNVPADGCPFSIDHPLGAAMMIRCEALTEVGLLDEAFFMYCEEVDWCLRARAAGWGVFQLPNSRVIHHGGQSSRQFREAMLVELHRSRILLFRKHYSPAYLLAHRAITRLGLVRESLRARWRARRGLMAPEELSGRLSAYRTIGRL